MGAHSAIRSADIWDPISFSQISVRRYPPHRYAARRIGTGGWGGRTDILLWRRGISRADFRACRYPAAHRCPARKGGVGGISARTPARRYRPHSEQGRGNRYPSPGRGGYRCARRYPPRGGDIGAHAEIRARRYPEEGYRCIGASASARNENPQRRHNAEEI